MAKTPGTDDDDKVAESPEDVTLEGPKALKDDDGSEQGSGDSWDNEASDEGADRSEDDSVPDPEEPGDSLADSVEEAEPTVSMVEDPAPESPISPPPPPVAAPPARRRGLSVVLGGVLAALIGAGALYYASMEDWVTLGGPDEALLARIDALESSLSAASAAVTAAEAEIAALQGAVPDLSGVTATIDTVETAADANAEAIATLTTRLDGTDERLQEVAVQQIPEAELPKAISDAYDVQVADLLASIDARFATLQAGLDEKLAEIEATQTAAADAEAAAREAARLAQARAALAAVMTALEDGAAYAAPLETVAEFGAVEIPAILAEPAEDGIPSLAGLAAAFPAAAREALAAASAAAVEDGSLSRIEAFLRTQAGARSLTPREGDDPDAVLSRAEAALRLGDLDTAITELAGLPDVGQQAMADWIAMADTRREALAAAASLATQLEQN